MAALVDRPLAELLDEVAAREPAPGAGSSTALTCALAAALVEMAAAFTVARAAYADVHERAGAAGARARELRAEALALAERERSSYQPVLDALRLPGDDPSREQRLRDALSDAADAPLAIAAGAAELAALAGELAEAGNAHLRGESIAAAVLAEAACRAAVALVELDLAEHEGDERRRRAAGLAAAAEAARAQALAG